MFTNLLKKIADRGYLIFCQCFFDFTSGGEQNCKIRIATYGLNGDYQQDLDMSKITNDFSFIIYGGYMVIWLAQMMDDVATRQDSVLAKKMDEIFRVLLDANKKYNLSDALSLFNQDTKTTVIGKHASVQFKIHKVIRNPIVRAVNLPLMKESEGQLYLFVILFDFFCKNYVNAHKVLADGCNTLIRSISDKTIPKSKPLQVIAFEITEAMAKAQFKN